MINCAFCNIDKSKIFNTIFEETKNFIVMSTLGALVDGYVLIVSKKHIYNMFEINDELKNEYFNLINKYRKIFKNIYNKYPIVFEHGSSKYDNNSASSVVHAHTHIVNHNFKDENNFLKDLCLEEFDNSVKNDKSYIFYISPNNKYYISYNFETISQLIRVYIARDIGIENKYNWRKNKFYSNIIKTINNIKNY